MRPTNESLRARREAATPRGVAVLAPFSVARAENAELWCVEGRRYIDFAAGIAVLNTGHRHPTIMAAVARQLEAFTHTAYQVAPYESYVALAERLNALVPGPFARKTALFSTGAEAVENAVKIARAHTGRPGVIAFGGGFHGRTLLALALTGKTLPYKAGFGPFPADVYHAPFPNALEGVSVADSLRAIDALFRADIEPRRVAALVIEPVQGEGGFYVAPPELLQALRALCDEHGIVFVVDEVQTGFGRTGTMFAHEQAGVHADLIVMAKSLAGGFPLAAVCGRADIMDAPAPGGLGGTYAGNPVAVAAAHAVLDVLAEERLVERAGRLGARLRERLEAARGEVKSIADVRGLGAMIAAEFYDPERRAPDPAFARRVQAEAMARGLLLLTCGVHGNVLRFLFPLTVPEAVFDEGLAILDEALRAARGLGPRVVMSSARRTGWWRMLWAALGLGFLLLFTLWAGQRALLFPAPRVAREPQLPPGALRHVVRLGSGAELPAFAWPAPEGAPTLVYYHGNGEQLADLVPIGEAFHEAGLGFFTAEYPGYALARAAGGPTEARLYEGAEAALGHLQGALGVPIERTVLVGHSLGSGVATEMAVRGRGGSLVLLSPFTSIGDMAAHLLPWLPGRFLVRDPFDSLSKAPRVIVPALVVHGVNDALIPAAMGQRLGAALVQGRVELVPGAGHNDLFSMYGETLVPLIAGFARGGGR